MADESFTTLGAQLRDRLESSAGQPPSAARLRRRHTRRRTAQVVSAAAAVLLIAVVTPSLVGNAGVVIDPVAPSPHPTEDASPPREPQDERAEVRPIDMPEPVAARLLAARFNGPSLALLDLAAGELAVHRLGVHGLPADAISGALMTSTGSIVVWQDDTVRVFTDGLTSPTLEHTPDELINPAGAAPSIRVVPTHDERALWVFQIGSCCPGETPGQAELVDLDTGRVQHTVQIPPTTFPVVATPDGVLLNTIQFRSTSGDAANGWIEVPGSEQALLLTNDGTVTDVADGQVLAANDDSAAIRSCEEPVTPENCELSLVDLATGITRALELPVEGTTQSAAGPAVPGDFTPWPTVSTDGRMLLTVNVHGTRDQKPAESHLLVIDPTTNDRSVIRRFDGSAPPAAWDRQGERILIVDGSELTIVDPTDLTSFTLHDAVPENHFVVGIN